MKQKMLAIVFAIVLVSSIGIVAFTESIFATNGGTSETLWRTDIDAETSIVPFEKTNPAYFDEFRTGYYQFFQTLGNNYLFNKTAVYTGNNTYSIAVNGSANTIAQWGQYVFEIPNLPQWIIEGWNITFSKNLDPDLQMVIDVFSTDSNSIKETGETGGTNLFINFGLGGAPGTKVWENRTLAKSIALDVYDKAQDGIKHFIIIQIIDNNKDGLSPWTFDLELHINGKKTATFDLAGALSIGLVFAIGLKMIVAVYMTDAIDLGVNRRDLPQKRPGRPKGSGKGKTRSKRSSAWVLPASALGLLLFATLTASAQTPEPSILNQIDLLILLPITVLLLTALVVWQGKFNIFLGIIMVGISIFIVWLASAYTTLLITPLSNSLFFGFTWGLLEWLVLIDIIMSFILMGIALWNAFFSEGKKVWA